MANILLRISLLSLTTILFSLLISQPERILSVVFLVLLSFYQVWLLYRYVSKVNRDLAAFLIYTKEGDITVSYPEKVESTFSGLKDTFHSIQKKFEQIRREREQREIYLNTVVDHVQTGIIGFSEDGKIELLNDSARELLSIPLLKHLDDLEPYSEGLNKALLNATPGKQKIIKVKSADRLRVFAIQTAKILVEGRMKYVVSLQDIQSELEANELDSYRKLTRIIAHEIMNSLTPITTLTKAIRNNLPEAEELIDVANISTENVIDIRESTLLIDDRSNGLAGFVDKYRSLSQLPNPEIQELKLRAFLSSFSVLFRDRFDEMNIKFDIEVLPVGLTLFADENLMRQVFINLIQNALRALENIDNPRLYIYASQPEQEQLIIQIRDNGKGISAEYLDKIFLPFFTTNSEGSGIGLSLSKQILHLHGAVIIAESSPGKGSCFTIRF